MRNVSTLAGVRFAWLLAAALVSLPACREKSRPDPEVRMAVSHERPIEPTPSAARAGVSGDVPMQLEVPPEVTRLYRAIRVAWRDKAGGGEGVIEVPIGGAVPLPDPAFVVRADAFLPAFAMGRDVITSEGVEPTNPAARIAVFEKGNQIFGGWIFTNFPAIHPFTHPRYELRLSGGVRSGS